jgi:hypothetical protein
VSNTQGLVLLEGLSKLKKANEFMGIRTLDEVNLQDSSMIGMKVLREQGLKLKRAF